MYKQMPKPSKRIRPVMDSLSYVPPKTKKYTVTTYSESGFWPDLAGTFPDFWERFTK